MLVTTRAIVLQAIRYSEADLIVKCFTQSSGLKSYLLRNVLKSKKGKLKASMFQPFTLLEIVANHRDKNTLEHIREAKVTYPFRSIHTNIHKSSMVMFLAEVVRSVIQEEEQNEALFYFLEETMLRLDQEGEYANFHLLFMVKLTQYLGFYPNDIGNEAPYFNLLDGGFQFEETNSYCISNKNTVLLRHLLQTDFQSIDSLKLNRSSRTNFLTMMLTYYQLHIHGFRKPNSLEILHQLF